MPEWIEQLKILLPLLGVVCIGAGFYYTTNHRLDHLEEIVEELSRETENLQDTVEKLETSRDNLKSEISKIRKNLSKKQDKRK